MMISDAIAVSAVPASGRGVAAGAERGGGAVGFGPEYRVELASGELAVNTAAVGITESKMRNVLTRILLESLFGVDRANRRSGKESKESAEEEMVREVAVEPVAELQLQQIDLTA